MQPVRIGIIGVGNISGIYLKNLSEFRSTEIVAVADIDLDRAKSVAERHGIPQALSPEALIASSDVEFVLNLTIPNVHGSVALQAVRAGKHVYNEKPLSVETYEAKLLLEEASNNGVLVGCAPDTFLGGGIQTCRALIDSGAIGEPVAANAFMLCHGHETWHPSPEFYYQKGGGPMLDMGPYYITALINLLGGIRRVTGSTRISFPTRTISSQPKFGKIIDVETSTHLTGTMDFVGGVIGQITTSFDVYPDPLPNIVIYGSEGSLIVPDPNGFGGVPKIRGSKESEFQVVELTHGYSDNERGIGVADMCHVIRNGGAHRASGALAYHALEVMHAFTQSSETEKHVHLTSMVERPAPMDTDTYADERQIA